MPSPSFTIRPAKLEDVESIARFNLALCRETENRDLDPDVVKDGVANFLAHPRRGRYYIAEAVGQVIGQTAHTYEWSDWRNGELWWIQSVYVHPAHRGKGVFRSLFEHIRQLGDADPDCCGIRLYMERENDTARRSYLNLGFTATGYEVFETLL